MKSVFLTGGSGFVGGALLERLIERGDGVRALARSEEAAAALRARGAEVDVVAVYETVADPLDPETLEAAAGSDCVTFTSASTVRFFAEAAGPEALRRPRIASIGPATSAELREHGLEPAVEASVHTPDGLVEALLADAAARG